MGCESVSSFRRAAARQHIVQSALSQRLQRPEGELGMTPMDRTTHHVRLTAAGAVFLADARQILAHVERAAVAAQRATPFTAEPAGSLRMGVVDASYDWMSLILHEVQGRYSDLETHLGRGRRAGAVPTPGGQAARRRHREPRNPRGTIRRRMTRRSPAGATTAIFPTDSERTVSPPRLARAAGSVTNALQSG